MSDFKIYGFTEKELYETYTPLEVSNICGQRAREHWDKFLSDMHLLHIDWLSLITEFYKESFTGYGYIKGVLKVAKGIDPKITFELIADFDPAKFLNAVHEGEQLSCYVHTVFVIEDDTVDMRLKIPLFL